MNLICNVILMLSQTLLFRYANILEHTFMNPCQIFYIAFDEKSFQDAAMLHSNYTLVVLECNYFKA